ncbi:MAG TPA: 2-hydroxyacid dehydrogenase [Pantanalinema sp.]
MNIAVFDTRPYDRASLDEANEAFGHALTYFESRLGPETVALAKGFPAVCAFVNDTLDAEVLATLREGGTRLVALRCAGFNNVDVGAAEGLGLTVVRVPAYSPYAVAEHAVALLLSLNRKTHRAYARVREGNFSLSGLVGFDLHGKTVGIVGTGRIGAAFARIMHGFGCRLLAHDPYPDPALSGELGLRYVPLEELLSEADVVSLHLPLSHETTHLIDDAAIARMKPGALLLNTSRGGLVDTGALIKGLKSGKLGGAGLDVYEREAGLFFEDMSGLVLQDDQLARLLTFPNVLITAHQAFLTDTALRNIAETTLDNVTRFEAGGESPNAVTARHPLPPRT